MNFLAHIYLSGNEEEIIVGNFMGDYVKGRDYLKYPNNIKEGLLIHRKIDYFTDCHPITRQSKRHVDEKYGKYAGIIIDIFYDFFLINDWNLYCNTSLNTFVNNTFELLKRNYDIFPQGIKNWFPNFIRNNWLMAYSTPDGIEEILHRMVSRTSLPDHTDFAIDVLIKDHDQLRMEFNEFFPDIRKYMHEEFGIITGAHASEVVFHADGVQLKENKQQDSKCP